MPLALATAPAQAPPPITPPSPRGRIRWSGPSPAGAGATGIDSGGVADSSANLVASVVLRGAEEGLHTPNYLTLPQTDHRGCPTVPSLGGCPSRAVPPGRSKMGFILGGDPQPVSRPATAAGGLAAAAG
jgi:hypothetical protein